MAAADNSPNKTARRFTAIDMPVVYRSEASGIVGPWLCAQVAAGTELIAVL
jgi:hypothetical protein